MIILRPIAISESTTSKFVCTFAPVTVFDVFTSAIDFADSVSLIHTNASIGRPAQEDPPLLKFFRQILKLLKPGQASNSRCPASFFWESCLPPYSAAGLFQTFKSICLPPLSQRPVGFYCHQRLQFYENPQLLPSQKLELHLQEDLLATP